MGFTQDLLTRKSHASNKIKNPSIKEKRKAKKDSKAKTASRALHR
jgi:hypothetical protein